MVCIYCSGNTQVTNSRHQKRNNSTWRRRACTICKTIFTTVERIELQSSLVIKSVTGLQPLSRDSLLLTVYESCKHRSNALEESSSLVNTIIGNVLRKVSDDGVIEQELLDAIIVDVLHNFDPAAATIFSAYRK